MDQYDILQLYHLTAGLEKIMIKQIFLKRKSTLINFSPPFFY
jgi:hypothetical protein